MATELSFKPLGVQVKEKAGLERVADVDPRLTRSHYFDSRLLTAEDLNRDQIYLDGRLREVGQALGYGVLRGLEIRLDNDDPIITIEPGVGVSRAGRVLELTRTLSINIGERADISELNNGRYRRIDRALYAVIIQYSEQGTDIAEVFPTDLGEKRNFSYDVITEGVQVLLVRLPQALGQQNSINIRAQLLREWLHDGTAGGGVPEDGVALGVLAVSGDKPLWLDPELLRQPLRPYDLPGDTQRDLSRRYEHLFNELLVQRASLNGDFAATDYFPLLPPVGKLPKDAIDPASGRQGFFPEHFNIWIAPVRLSDVEFVRAESMSLPPIDLSVREPIDIIVMVPLANADYGKHAQKLERPTTVANPLLPSQNLLRLRLFPQLPVHEIDTDEGEWKAIWNKVSADSLFYIRRPLRAAETRLSAIVLAQGVPVPANAPALPPSPADSGLLVDADKAFLAVLNLEQLYALRPPVDATARAAGEFFVKDSGTDVTLTQYTYKIMALVDRHYDDAVWQTIPQLAFSNDELGGTLDILVELLSSEENRGKETGTLIADAAEKLVLKAELKTLWQKLAGEKPVLNLLNPSIRPTPRRRRTTEDPEA